MSEQGPLAPRFAEVAVNSPISRGTATFHYAIPPSLSIEVGQLVLVPFGTRRMQGVVLDLLMAPEVETIKEIDGVIDTRPVLSAAQVALARWLAEYYAAPLFDAIRLMLPAGLAQNLETRFELAPDRWSQVELTAKQRAVVDLLRRRDALRVDQIGAALDTRSAATVAGQLVRLRVLRREVHLRQPRVAPKLARFVELVAAADETSVRGTKQQEVLALLRRRGPMPQGEVVKSTGCTSETIAGLAKRGLVAVVEREVRRDPLAHLRAARLLAPSLTPAQQVVWREIADALEDQLPQPNIADATGAPSREHLPADHPPVPPEDAQDAVGAHSCAPLVAGKPTVFLLHGVTGSGKTELYLRAVEQVVLKGRQAIVLVPEISLTPQTVHRFASRFPGMVAVLHSKLSPGERYDEWRRIRDGSASVVVGSRSAIFAPAARLALIVLDEEHEWSYKQDRAPRYHAREVALKLAALTGAKVIFGSATPDVESYHRAELGRYRLLTLRERVLSGPATGTRVVPPLPPVQIVDMRRELRAGNRSIFSVPLRDGIQRALAARQQVILFLNRRGTSSFVACRDCGLVVQCRYCDFSLVFHGDVDQLVCHQCNHRRPVPRICPECGGTRIKFFGIGTQKVEEETRREFPGARVLRWDRDVTGGKLAHEELMRSFTEHEADILVGTQMIAKGLDLPRVTLVGVISADVALHLPDLRAGERTFQLLTQVEGRAGRGELGGQAVVQTYSPGHYCVQAASRHDYAGFFAKEIAFRLQHGYPPFGRLARLIYSHHSDAQAERGATRLAEVLRLKIAQEGIPGTVVYGPAPAYHHRIRGKYRWQLFLRGAYVDRALAGVPTPLGWAVDVDPLSML